MVLAGIKVVDTPLVHEAIELVRNSSEPYLFNPAMRSWLFGVVIASGECCVEAGTPPRWTQRELT